MNLSKYHWAWNTHDVFLDLDFYLTEHYLTHWMRKSSGSTAALQSYIVKSLNDCKSPLFTNNVLVRLSSENVPCNTSSNSVFGVHCQWEVYAPRYAEVNTHTLKKRFIILCYSNHPCLISNFWNKEKCVWSGRRSFPLEPTFPSYRLWL